jgi:hypothetical protein
MDALLPPLQAGASRERESMVLCSYRNATNQMVIVRARGEGAFFLERVVFPFEIMTFHCPVEGDVEVIRRGVEGGEELETLTVEQVLAAEFVSETQADWRPARRGRSMSVRSNASSIRVEGC